MATEDLSDRPWLLVPGTLCTADVFDGFLDALGVPGTKRRYLELSFPSVEDYNADFNDVTEDTVVCGFSLGAIVAAHTADRMRPHSLILFGLNPFADDPDKAAARHALADDVKAVGGAAALKSRNPDVYGTTPDQTRAQIYSMADETAHMIEAQTQLALTRPGALPALSKARMSVLTLTGTRDTSAPAAQGRAAADAAPLSRFHALDGLGHFALLEDPAACAAAISSVEEV